MGDEDRGIIKMRITVKNLTGQSKISEIGVNETV